MEGVCTTRKIAIVFAYAGDGYRSFYGWVGHTLYFIDTGDALTHFNQVVSFIRIYKNRKMLLDAKIYSNLLDLCVRFRYSISESSTN